jgi:superfamily II DNA or RNA helicase
MTALDLLRPLTTKSAQHRAWDYVDRIVVLGGDAHSIEAEVQGTDLYDVNIRVDGNQLRVWCSCPYFSDQGSGCKHLWATAVVAGENGWLADIPAGARVVMDFEDGDEYELGPARAGPSTRIRSLRAGRETYEFLEPPRRTAPPPEWATALSVVTHDDGLAAPVGWEESQLLYVITAPAGATVTELALHIERRDRKRNGEWAKPQASRLTLNDIAHLPNDDDRWALSLLYGVSSYPRSAGSYGYGLGSQHLPTVYLKSSVLELLFPRLCPTGRVRLRPSAFAKATADKSAKVPGRPAFAKAPADKPVDDVTLAWEGGESWRFGLTIAAQNDGDGYRVDGVLIRGDTRADIDRFALLTDSLAVLDDVASRFDPAGGFRWAAHFRARGAFVVPAEASRALVESLSRSPVQHVELPAVLQWEERAVDPRFQITIGKPNLWGGLCSVSAFVEYGATTAPLDNGTRLLSADGRVMYRRDQRAERAALATLKKLGVVNIGPQHPQGPIIQARRVPALVHALVGEGWRVEAEGVRYRAIEAPRLHIKSGIDWFEIEAGESGAAAAPIDLSDLVKAIATGRRTVTLGDGTIGMLPEEWLARVAPLIALGDADGGTVRFKPSQVALIDALLAEQPAVDWDEGFARARAQLQRFAGVHPENAPPTFHGELREYQRESLGWMRFLRDFGFGGCLADDMGLGKTVMVLAMLEGRRLDAAVQHRPSLIVLPRSLLFNWMSEAARFAPGLRVLDFAHADRHSAVDAIPAQDVVLTTYGTLRRDVPVLKDHRFDYVVLDEAQAIKNAGTATAKAVRLLQADHRLALTGTPVENHIGELYSLFDFLNPGLLGRTRGPKATPTRTLRASGAPAGPRYVLQGEGPGAQEHVARIARGLRPFFLRRTKEQVAPELPLRTEETLYCELEGEQRRIYHELRDHYRGVLLKKIAREGVAKSKFLILEALLRLRQAACHTGLLPGRGPDRGPSAFAKATADKKGPRYVRNDSSAKFDLLLPRLEELADEGRKALVFSQFTSLLALLRERLDANKTTYEYLDGATRDRAARVERFQQDASCQLFLISLKAGGIGLNLTAAEYVFLLDPWWNPAVEMQAIDRTHRIGQTKPVFAYRLVARETVEERILELQSQKRALADAILDAGVGGLKGLQREDVECLLS